MSVKKRSEEEKEEQGGGVNRRKKKNLRGKEKENEEVNIKDEEKELDSNKLTSTRQLTSLNFENPIIN